MNFLIIGSGAREHAISRALKRSPQNPRLFCIGNSINPGIQGLTEHYFLGDICNSEKIVEQAEAWHIDIAIIGPEAPLAQGVADRLWEKGIRVIGPKKNLARIESSKSFTRDLLKKYHIPGSPQYHTFLEMNGIADFLNQLGENQYVIKADGLMAGKGVKVAGDHLHSIEEALQFCQELIASQQAILIEEKLIGQEFSLLSFCDGEILIPMPLIQDHKRAYRNDEGPNTGGMGSYSAADHGLPFLTEDDIHQAKKINEAVLKALMTECQDKYYGILYGSFIATKKGIALIEYNARFGDPEAMNVLTILESDFVSICEAMVTGNLKNVNIRFAHQATVCKYAVPLGYPHHAIKEQSVDISRIQHPDDLFYAGVNLQNGELSLTGGRALACVGVGQTLKSAESRAEAEMNRIMGNVFHREDIGTEAFIARKIKQMQELRQCD